MKNWWKCYCEIVADAEGSKETLFLVLVGPVFALFLMDKEKEEEPEWPKKEHDPEQPGDEDE